MNCEDVKEKYQLYLDGELDAAEVESFKQHIEQCSQCGRILKFERHFHMTITKKFKSRSAPDELIKKIRTKLF
jgi:mycothiol system anti-sigma-R factor